MRSKIHIQEVPFEEIIRSIYETLKLESQGILFGEIYEKRDSLLWVVESAHPIQLTQRFPTRTIPEEGASRGNWSVLNPKLGEYHLHTFRKNYVPSLTLSDIDKEGIREHYPNGIEVVILLKEVKRAVKLRQNPDLISGYIEDKQKKYRVDLAGYYYNGGIRRAEITVPRRVLKMMQ